MTRVQVSIFMSPLNVHINFNPIGGTTTYYKYHHRKYLVAWREEQHRERAQHGGGEASAPWRGALPPDTPARWPAASSPTAAQATPAEQGAEFGFIKFGSRVDVFLPKSATIAVKIGDVVQGSTSVIARFQP